jgi:hypothetical protein
MILPVAFDGTVFERQTHLPENSHVANSWNSRRLRGNYFWLGTMLQSSTLLKSATGSKTGGMHPRNTE